MPSEQGLSNVHEAVGVFHDVEALERAIDALLEAGFDRADISLLASSKTVEEKLGRLYQKVQELEDDPDAPRAAYVSEEAIGAAEGSLIGGPLYVTAGLTAGIMAAVGGPLAATIAAVVAGGGAGALIGGILARLLGKHHAAELENQLHHGGLLLWVRTWTQEQQTSAKDILGRHSAHDVHIHQLPPQSKTK